MNAWIPFTFFCIITICMIFFFLNIPVPYSLFPVTGRIWLFPIINSEFSEYNDKEGYWLRYSKGAEADFICQGKCYTLDDCLSSRHIKQSKITKARYPRGASPSIGIIVFSNTPGNTTLRDWKLIIFTVLTYLYTYLEEQDCIIF